MNSKTLFVWLIAAAFASPMFAFGQDRPNPIKHLLFTPELIMKNRAQLNLEDEQQDFLKTEMQRAQADVFDLKWEMNDESERLAEILKTTPIDESELLVQADKVMALEHQIKRTHLTLLVRLKNMLSKEQIDTLRRLRRAKPTDERRSNSR